MTQEITHIPKLRFPEFEGEFVEKTISGLFELVSGQHLNPDEYSLVNGIKPYFTGPTDFTNTEKKVNKWSLKSTKDAVKNDILITVKGSGVGEQMFLNLNEVAMGRQLMAIRAKRAKTEFLYHWMPKKRPYLRALASGNMIPGLSRKDILQLKIFTPSKTEQQKIATFLSSVDQKIEKLQRKKDLLTDYKKGMMQKLFSQELRFKDDQGNDFPDWEEKKLNTFLNEHSNKSKGSESVHSVSVHKGVIDQIEHLGRSFSAKDTGHYSLVYPNDIIYTKSPTGDFPFGIIKQSHKQENVIVSPLYGVFTPETPFLGYWLHCYFESSINTCNYLNSIVQKGAKNTINITNKTFLSKSLKVPNNSTEQQKIADYLTALDQKIELITQKLNHAQAFKKGLLQQIFV